MSVERGKKTVIKVFIIIFLLAAYCLAAEDWVIFKGQVNGMVKDPDGIDLETFKLKKYQSLFWTEGYYHHVNSQDGSMITVSIGFNLSEANVAFVYGKPGIEPYSDYVIIDFDEAQFDQNGFGFRVDKNRVRLDGNKYILDIQLEKTKARIEYEILGPSYNYGDNMVRYPDGKTFMYYSLPISWARVKVDALLDGRECSFEGHGNMNHDAGVIFPVFVPSNWQVFWFFGEDHALAVTDHYTHEKFGKQLTQRLVFVDKHGNMFTSTSFKLVWYDWVKAEDVPFRYPCSYKLFAQHGTDELRVDVGMKETLLIEDLYGNLPYFLKLVVERLTPNAWTMDSWSEYTICLSRDGKTQTYKGHGVARYTDLEEK